jgi:hypothetical protein
MSGGGVSAGGNAGAGISTGRGAGPSVGGGPTSSGRVVAGNPGAGRGGNWNNRHRFVRRNHGPVVSFGIGTGWVGDDYAYEDCGWVRVKRIIRHRAVWQRVWRCY